MYFHLLQSETNTNLCFRDFCIDLTTVRVDEEDRARDLFLMVAAFCQRPGEAEARMAKERPREVRQIRPPANGETAFDPEFISTFSVICCLFLAEGTKAVF